MSFEIIQLEKKISDLSLKNKIIKLNILSFYAIKIQKCFKGYITRSKRLPIFLYVIKKYLKSQLIELTKKNKDGRINSCDDENIIINILLKKFNKRIKIPSIRMWYDILIFDYKYKWLPVNIKTTTMNTNDNTGNLAMCVYSYTDQKFNFDAKTYTNGNMSKILIKKINNKNNYNYIHKKDYYFIVINKNDTNNIIINSLKGLNILTPNINNLPFQICWNKNKEFKYDNIRKKNKRIY